MLNGIIDTCKTSRLYDIGAIQAYGILIAIDVASGNIVACSENIGDLYEFSADQLIGNSHTNFDLFDEMTALINSSHKSQHRFLKTKIDTRTCSISAHSNGIILIIEIEPSELNFASVSSDRIGFMHDLALISDPEEAAKFLMEKIAEVINFDRVMLYKYLPEWHGLVIAERLRHDVKGFLNLHFPAGDVPENARKLYTINLQRYIADTESSTFGIAIANITALDLTYSQLRAVHPVHIEYLKNIGARSSFSVSIIADEKLWGTIACHHQTQRQLDFSQRFYCEELARMASLHITGLVAMRTTKHRFEIELLLAKVKGDIEKGPNQELSLTTNLETLMAAFKADSILLKRGESLSVLGAVRNTHVLSSLLAWIGSIGSDEVWHSNRVPEALENLPDLKRYSSGTLYLPLGKNDYLMLLRNEQIESQQWAGDPTNLGQTAEEKLTPRASFEIWARETYGTAEAWTEIEVQIASEFSKYLAFNLDRLQLEHAAMQDSLTGLPNRRKFYEDLHQLLNAEQIRPRSFAVYMLDLDRFKYVNDTLGHHAGDELLTLVGHRLKRLLRENDTVARLGGDEFAIIQNNIKNDTDIKMLADRIIEDLGHVYSLQAGKADISVSIGIAVYTDLSDNAETLIARADTALYSVKERGRNSWMLWTP